MTVSGLSPSTTYFLAIKTSDEVPNTSALSNVPSLTTLPPLLVYGTGADIFDQTKVVAGFNDLNIRSITTGRTVADMVNFSVTTNLAPGATSIPLGVAPIGLAAGDEVLIINLQQIGGGSLNPVGEWETRRIASMGGSDVTLTAGLSSRYDGTRYRIMLQRVPNYNQLTINAGQQLGASAWNGTKGGVFFMRVANTLTINAGGEITMVGVGYRGGGSGIQGESRSGAGSASINNNDGGGGGFSGIITGGGGGAGYAAAGGRGGTDPDIGWGWGGDGGTAYGDTNLVQLFLGSGGGGGGGCASGRGGDGGGIVYIPANVFVNSGAVRTNASGAVGGCPVGQFENIWTGSGGGSGGSIFLQSSSNQFGTVETLGTSGLAGNVGQYCQGFTAFCYNNRNKGGNGSDGRTVIIGE